MDPAGQYPPAQPSHGAYPPAYPPPTQQYPPPGPEHYPPPGPEQYPPATAYPAYPSEPQPQPPPYDPGFVQQQQTNNTVVVTAVPTAATTTAVFHTAIKPPNYLALSLLNLLCCCWILGIFGLVYSLRVDSEFAAGRYEEARRASEAARNINYIGIGIGVFLVVAYIIIIIASIAAS